MSITGLICAGIGLYEAKCFFGTDLNKEADGIRDKYPEYHFAVISFKTAYALKEHARNMLCFGTMALTMALGAAIRYFSVF